MKRIILLAFGLLAGVGTMPAGENPFGNIMGSLPNYPVSFAFNQKYSIDGYWRPEMPVSEKSEQNQYACLNGQNKVGSGNKSEGLNRVQGNKGYGEGYGNQGGKSGYQSQGTKQGGFGISPAW